MNSARHQSIRARHTKLQINTTFGQNAILFPNFCKIGGGGGLGIKPIRSPSIGLSVRPSVCHKTLTWLISSEVLKI